MDSNFCLSNHVRAWMTEGYAGMASTGERLLRFQESFSWGAARRALMATCAAVVSGVAWYALLRSVLGWYMGYPPDAQGAFAASHVRGAWLLSACLGGATGLLWLSSCARKVDKFLFAAYDRRAMLPIARDTGLLGFCLPEAGPQRMAWDTLLAWATAAVAEPGDRSAATPTAEPAFAWTALIGPSGSGKTQLGKELARYLAQRGRYGDACVDGDVEWSLSRLRLHISCWLRRVVPYCSSRLDPFDAGLLAFDQLEGAVGPRSCALAEFRPRAPTLWILDSPGLGVLRQVIAIVQQQAPNYRHPLRLIVIDEQVGVDWPLTPLLDGSFAYSGGDVAFTPVVLPADSCDFALFSAAAHFRWDRRVGHRPVLKSNHDLLPLHDPARIQVLFAALAAKPLRLALAVHWLAADRQRNVEQLLSEIERIAGNKRSGCGSAGDVVESMLAHDLARRLQRAFRELEGPASAGGLGCAMASATLAGGLPLSRSVRQLFAVVGSGERLRELLRAHPAEAVPTLPAVEPKAVGAAFLQLTRESEFSRSPELFSTQVVQCALRCHPASTLSGMVHGGAMAHMVAEVLLHQDTPEQPALHMAHFTATMISAIGGDEAMLARAMALAATLPEAHLGSALSTLERTRCCYRQADPLTVGAIYCALACRILCAEGVRPEAFPTILCWLRRWLFSLARNQLLRQSSEYTRKRLLEAFAEVVSAVLQWAERTPARAFESLLALDEEVVSRAPAVLLQYVNSAVGQRLAAAGESPVLLAWASLWRVRGEVAAGRLPAAEQALRVLSRDIGDNHLPVRQTVLLRMKAQVAWVVLLNRLSAGAKVEAAVAEVAVMAELFAAAPLAFPELTLERARALEALSYARRSAQAPPAAVAEVAVEVERLLAGFGADSPAFGELVLSLARVRCHAAAASSRQPDLRAQTIDQVEGVVRIIASVSKGYPLYPELVLVAVEAWTHACATRRDLDSYWAFVSEATGTVARMLSPFIHTPFSYPELLVQWARMFLQVPVPESGAASAAAIEAVEQHARQVEALLAPFASRPLVYPMAVECCAAAQAQIVALRAAGQPQSAELDQAVTRVLAALQPFTEQGIDHPQVRLIGARALRQLVEARARIPELHSGIESAVQQIGRMVSHAGASPVVEAQLVHEWALAGASLAFVGSQLSAGTRIAELGARVVQRSIERLGGLSMAGDDVVLLWAQALQWVALSCSREPGQRSHALQAAQQIDRLVGTRSRAAREAYLLPRARAWAAVAAARRWIGEQRLRTEDAAWKVEALAEPKSAAFHEHVELMQLWARAWGDVAWACGAIPDQSARAAKAAAHMRYVVTEFARDCYQELLDVERMLAALPGQVEDRPIRSSGVVSRNTLFGEELLDAESAVFAR